MTQSSADLLDEWFEFDPLKGTKSASGIIGTFLGPRSPGTAYVLLHHYMGEIDGAFRAWGFAKNGTGGVSAAIARSAQALGAEIRTGAPVQQVIVKGGRASGVALENGDELQAKVVLSAADPEAHLPAVRRIRSTCPTSSPRRSANFRVRGSSGKVNIALSGLPDFTCLPGEGPLHRGAISISPSMDYIERAYDEAKYGQFSKQAVHRHHHPLDDRPRHGAARAPRHVLLRAVRALRHRGRLGRRQARGLRRGGDLDHRAVRAEHPQR